MNNENLQGAVLNPTVPTNMVGDNTIDQNVASTPIPSVEVSQQNAFANPGVISNPTNVTNAAPNVEANLQNTFSSPTMMASANNSVNVTSSAVLNAETNQVNSGVSPVVSNLVNNASEMVPSTLETANNDTLSQNMVSEVATPDTSVVEANNGNSFISGISVKRYLGYMFLYSIPCIGFVFLIMDAFVKKDTDIRNYAKAYFIFLLIIFGIIAILYFIAVMVLKLNFAY